MRFFRLLPIFFCLTVHATNFVKLSSYPADSFSCEWGTAKLNKSIDDSALTIGNKRFKSGVGVHAHSIVTFKLDGKVLNFSATVGARTDEGSVEFLVKSNSKILWRSGIMKAKAQQVDVQLTGLKSVTLEVTDGGDGIAYDHANWCNAEFTYAGSRPEVSDYMDQFILTPPAPKTPQINGAKVFGVRPGKVFMFQVAATGNRPMSFSATKLPEGLQINQETGLITGKIKSLIKRDYIVKITAENALGKTSSNLKISVGDEICLTPPMGWNSWYCHSESISQKEMEKIAQAFVDKGLINYGWTYVNIDDCWQSSKRNENGAIIPNERFPNMKAMCDKIHAMGLKVGLYSVPWVGSYAGFIGSSSDHPTGKDDDKFIPESRRLQKSQVFGRYPGLHKQKVDHVGKYWFGDKDALQWAEWGFDYIKYDWKPNDIPTTKKIVNDLAQCDRDIVLSLSNAAPFNETKNGLKDLANLWRTGGDIHNSWHAVSLRFDTEPKWQEFSRPGHWNDPDMLQIGKSATPNRFNRVFRPSRLTPGEQFSHVTLWSMLAAPLLLSCDVENMSNFTLSLITNNEVIAVNQDQLGVAAKRVFKKDGIEIWVKPLYDGTKALALFNRSNEKVDYTMDFNSLGLPKNVKIRGLWRQRDEGEFTDSYTTSLNRHGVKLIKISQQPEFVTDFK